MIVGLDTNFLALLLHPAIKPPYDPETGVPVKLLEQRLRVLVDEWNRSRTRVVVPTPVLAEFLVFAGEQANAYLNELTNLAHVSFVPFDLKAAVEASRLELNDRRAEWGKRGAADANTPWQKIKVDRQIVAITKIANASLLYTDDKVVRALAVAAGIAVQSSWQLPLPPGPTLPFPSSE